MLGIRMLEWNDYDDDGVFEAARFLRPGDIDVKRKQNRRQ